MAQATIGGMIGNNSAGARSILYGRTVEHLLSLDVLLADGTRMNFREGAAASDARVRDLTQRIANVVVPREREIEAAFPTIVRHVDGYNLDIIARQIRESTTGSFDRVNLAHLVCGSEGTLAVTVEAELNLVPRPSRYGLAIVSARDVDEALGALTDILRTKPSAVELIDDVLIGVARQNSEYARYVELLPSPPSGSTGAVLYVEFSGNSDAELVERFAALKSTLPRNEIREDHHSHRAGCGRKRRSGETSERLRNAARRRIAGRRRFSVVRFGHAALSRSSRISVRFEAASYL
jgi:FAD/FMN-containing dehydrogenase